MSYISVNGKIQDASLPALNAASQAYRFGMGLFETMYWKENRIPLFSGHMERLWKGFDLLGYQLPALLNPEKLKQDIDALCRKITGGAPARVRLSFSPGNGGFYDGDQHPAYLIEAWPLDKALLQLNTNGLVLGIFPDSRKTTDVFSPLKTNSFLIYGLAARYAKAQQWNDALVLNTSGGIADSTIANLFLINQGIIRTPAIAEGPVAGVMRQHLIQQLRSNGFKVEETRILPEELDSADEIFLTNAIRGLRWVGRCGEKIFGNALSTGIYRDLVQTILC